MDNERRGSAAPSKTPETHVTSSAGLDLQAAWQRVVRRRSFLQAGVGLGVATAALPAGALLTPAAQAAAEGRSSSLSAGDVAILRFLQAVETVENDLWVQYNELGGNNGIANGKVHFNTAGVATGYKDALQFLDSDMPQYVSDNADDELSHMLFLAAYLQSKGAEPADLSKFATQPPSQVSGVPQHKRLTNLQNLTVDTSYYTRYRSPENPDFGATFAQAVNIVNEPGIPPTNADDVTPSNPADPTTRVPRTQAIANTAAFHFGFIEQGGSSLYPILALKVTNLEVLRIVLSIGGVEVDHFSLWHDKVSGAVTPPLNVTDPVTGVTFPDFSGSPGDDSLTQTNLILPEPCDFISTSLPQCSVIRPTLDANGGAVATINAFAKDGLFGTGKGFNQDFFNTLIGLAKQADAAQRQGQE